jgi:hypothetical protein
MIFVFHFFMSKNPGKSEKSSNTALMSRHLYPLSSAVQFRKNNTLTAF